MRLDLTLVSRKLYSTRARAVAAVRAGLVRVNGVVAKKQSQIVAETDDIVAGALPYSAGRGSLKLVAGARRGARNCGGCRDKSNGGTVA